MNHPYFTDLSKLVSVYNTVQSTSAYWEESAEILPTVTNYLSTNNVLLSGLTVTGPLCAIINSSLLGDNILQRQDTALIIRPYILSHNRTGIDFQKANGERLWRIITDPSATQQGDLIVGALSGSNLVNQPSVVWLNQNGNHSLLGNWSLSGNNSPNVLTVTGTISTRDFGTSELWNSVYSTVRSTSASWEESAEILPTVTNYLSTNNVLISGLSVTLTVTALKFKAANGSNFIDGETVYSGGFGGTLDLRGGDGSVDGSSPGGNITMRGGILGSRSGNINLNGAINSLGARGGDIDLSAANDSAGFGSGGDLIMRGGINGNAGSINTSANGGNGGYINTSSSIDYGGGFINTSGGIDASGGSISTNNGGGSINTGGTGSVQLGIDGTRTTFTGSATQNRSISLPDASGVLALQLSLSAIQQETIDITLDQQYKLLTVNNTTSGTVIIPADDTVNFPDGAQVNITRLGTGTVYVSASPGVYLRSADNKKELRVQYSTATVVKLSANDWLLFGDIV